MYEQMASKLKKFGGILKCESCGREMRLNNISLYLQSGWPKCCGYTMRWITKNEMK